MIVEGRIADSRPTYKRCAESTKRVETARERELYLRCAKLPRMPLIIILIILVLLFGGGGYYMGPGVGYYGGGGLSLVLAIVVIYLIFGRGRSAL